MISMQNYILGMRVEVVHKCTSARRTGEVIQIEETRKIRMIDSKPISSRRVTKVKISYDQGGFLELEENNYYNYKVRELK